MATNGTEVLSRDDPGEKLRLELVPDLPGRAEAGVADCGICGGPVPDRLASKRDVEAEEEYRQDCRGRGVKYPARSWYCSVACLEKGRRQEPSLASFYRRQETGQRLGHERANNLRLLKARKGGN